MKVALVELGDSHAECLYSQLLFLKKSGAEVHLICSSAMEPHVWRFEEADSISYFPYRKGRWFRNYLNMVSIRKLILKKRVDKVVFNTVEEPHVRHLLGMIFPSAVEFVGILHDAASYPKVALTRVRKFFVLNDYILYNVTTRLGKVFASFYPIFFQKYRLEEFNKPKGETWICIPGQVEFKRRDYLALFDALKEQRPKEGLRFILLGRSDHPSGNGREVKDLIRKEKLEKFFMLFEGYIDDVLYHSYLKSCDYVMPLIHPENPAFETYMNNQVSGAYNLAFAYQIPLLCHKALERYPDFRDTSIFYTPKTLVKTLNGLSKLKRGRFYRDPKWKFDTQRGRYIDFLTSQPPLK